MRRFSYFFFYTYIGLVIIAGFWGAFINPYFDFNLLFNYDVHTLQETSAHQLVESVQIPSSAGAGFWAILHHFHKKNIYRKNIQHLVHFNHGFMTYDKPPKEMPEGLESIYDLGLDESWLPPPTTIDYEKYKI